MSHQLSSASTHSLPSRIDQISDGEDDFEEDEDSSSALDPYELDSTPTNTSPEVILGTGRKYSSWYVIFFFKAVVWAQSIPKCLWLKLPFTKTVLVEDS